MSNFICSECGMTNIDCGYAGYKTPKEIELEKENKKLKERIADAEHILDEMGWADRGLIDDYFEKWGVK